MKVIKVNQVKLQQSFVNRIMSKPSEEHIYYLEKHADIIEKLAENENFFNKAPKIYMKFTDWYEKTYNNAWIESLKNWVK